MSGFQNDATYGQIKQKYGIIEIIVIMIMHIDCTNICKMLNNFKALKNCLFLFYGFEYILINNFQKHLIFCVIWNVQWMP